MAAEVGNGYVDLELDRSRLRSEALNHAVKIRLSTNARASIGDIVSDAEEMYKFLTGEAPRAVTLPWEVAQISESAEGGREVHFVSGSVARWTHDFDGLRVELNEPAATF